MAMKARGGIFEFRISIFDWQNHGRIQDIGNLPFFKATFHFHGGLPAALQADAT